MVLHKGYGCLFYCTDLYSHDRYCGIEAQLSLFFKPLLLPLPKKEFYIDSGLFSPEIIMFITDSPGLH